MLPEEETTRSSFHTVVTRQSLEVGDLQMVRPGIYLFSSQGIDQQLQHPSAPHRYACHSHSTLAYRNLGTLLCSTWQQSFATILEVLLGSGCCARQLIGPTGSGIRLQCKATPRTNYFGVDPLAYQRDVLCAYSRESK